MKSSVKFHIWLWSFLVILICFCLLAALGLNKEQNPSVQGLQEAETETRQQAQQIPLSTPEEEAFMQYGQYRESGLEKAFSRLNFLIRQIIGPNESNYTFFGEDGLYLQPTPALPEIYRENLLSLNSLVQSSGIPVSLMVLPDAGVIKTAQLPASAPQFEANQVLDEIFSMADEVQVLDMRPWLKKYQNEGVFFQTDHHWTSKMAGLAASKLVEMQEPFDFSGFNPYVVSNSFQGSLVQRVGQSDYYDEIVLYEYSSPPASLVTWPDGSQSDSIYYWQGLESWDQNQVFFGENQPIVTIDTDVPNERSILLLKDSYANAIIQFLLPYYNKITVVDPRFFAGDLNEVIQNRAVNEIAAIFWYDIFVSDGTLSDCISGSSLSPLEFEPYA